MASGQCKWQYSLAAPATVCDQRSSAAGSQPAPSRWSHRQPREPPCACAPAPGDKLLCADGLDEGARLLWRRDKPALPMRPWARKKEPEIDPFVILSTVEWRGRVPVRMHSYPQSLMLRSGVSCQRFSVRSSCWGSKLKPSSLRCQASGAFLIEASPHCF